jgi:hypothetical protein
MGPNEELAARKHDLGECEVKHGLRISVVNLYTLELGNPAAPDKLKAARVAIARRRSLRHKRSLSEVESAIPEKSIAVPTSRSG